MACPTGTESFALGFLPGKRTVDLITIVSREALAAGVFVVFVRHTPAASALRLTNIDSLQAGKGRKYGQAVPVIEFLEQKIPHKNPDFRKTAICRAPQSVPEVRDK